MKLGTWKSESTSGVFKSTTSRDRALVFKRVKRSCKRNAPKASAARRAKGSSPLIPLSTSIMGKMLFKKSEKPAVRAYKWSFIVSFLSVRVGAPSIIIIFFFPKIIAVLLKLSSIGWSAIVVFFVSLFFAIIVPVMSRQSSLCECVFVCAISNPGPNTYIFDTELGNIGEFEREINVLDV